MNYIYLEDYVEIGLKVLQLPNGVFCASKDGSESDMRFIYCAACISYIIDDWSGVNIEKATDYILKSLVSKIYSIMLINFNNLI